MKKLIFTMLLAFIAMSIPQEANAQKTKSILMWYKIKSGNFSKMVQTKKIVMVVPGYKSRSQTIRVGWGGIKESTSLKMGSDIIIEGYGSDSKPSPTAQSTSTTSTASNNEFTSTTTTTVYESGATKTETTTTNNQTGSQTTVTVANDGNNNITVTTDPPAED